MSDLPVGAITLPGAVALRAARLLIHAEGCIDATGRHFESALQRLRMLFSAEPKHDRRVPLRLRIEDLQGRPVLALDDAGHLVDVALPAGTYHVTADLGGVRRRYTMTLNQGSSFDLHLRLARQRH
jgi:hypothetical protein